MGTRQGKLTCDMTHDCTNPVTHIGEKGYAYCAHHVCQRQGVERTRKLKKWEHERLVAGKQIHYKLGRRPVDEGYTGEDMSNLIAFAEAQDALGFQSALNGAIAEK